MRATDRSSGAQLRGKRTGFGRLGALTLLLALGAALAPAAARAESWSLDRVLEVVRREDPALRAVRARAAAGVAQARLPYSAFSPRVNLRLGVVRSDDPALLFSEKLRQGRFSAADFELTALNQPAPETALQWSLSVDQPILNGAREFTAPARAAHLNRAARASGEAAAADELLRVVEIFVEALRAERALVADSAGLAAAEEGSRAAVERFRMGQVPELDTLRAAARRAEARAAWLDARKASRVALARLSARVGVEVGAADLVAIPAPGPAGEALAETADAGAARGEARAAREQAAAYSLDSWNAGLSLLPSINARASLDQYRDAHLGDYERRYMVAVSLDFPLWDGAQRFSQWRAAKAQARAAQAQAEALVRELKVQALEARAEMETAGERLEAARLGRRAAEEALRLALDRYRAGLLPLGEWLNAAAEAEGARAMHVDAEARVTLAGYRYQHAIGALK